MDTRNIDKQAAREQFERFVFDQPDRVELIQSEAKSIGILLDLSVSSLDRIETFFDQQLKRLPAGLDETDLRIICARYLGQVMVENYGGKWTLPLDDPESPNFNHPVVKGHNATGTEFAPLSLMLAYSLRHKKGLLRGAVEAQVNGIDPEILLEDNADTRRAV